MVPTLPSEPFSEARPWLPYSATNCRSPRPFEFSGNLSELTTIQMATSGLHVCLETGRTDVPTHKRNAAQVSIPRQSGLAAEKWTGFPGTGSKIQLSYVFFGHPKKLKSMGKLYTPLDSIGTKRAVGAGRNGPRENRGRIPPSEAQGATE